MWNSEKAKVQYKSVLFVVSPTPGGIQSENCQRSKAFYAEKIHSKSQNAFKKLAPYAWKVSLLKSSQKSSWCHVTPTILGTGGFVWQVRKLTLSRWMRAKLTDLLDWGGQSTLISYSKAPNKALFTSTEWQNTIIKQKNSKWKSLGNSRMHWLVKQTKQSVLAVGQGIKFSTASLNLIAAVVLDVIKTVDNHIDIVVSFVQRGIMVLEICYALLSFRFIPRY